jgi:uncharacterized protein
MNRVIGKILFAVLMFWSALFSSANAQENKKTEFLPPLTLGGMTFAHIEVARTTKAREIGLMNRKGLPVDGGMCFVFPDAAPRAFWMKNTLIPLDAIFIDAYGTIIEIVTMKTEAPQRPNESTEAYERRLPTYSCDHAITCVVELAAGTAKLLGLQPGDNIPELAWRALTKI